MSFHVQQTMSVVVCAYTEERWDDLVTAVSSLQHQTSPADEIIVVIDHNPELLARAQQHIQGITCVPNREMRGLSGARNTGIALAQGELIAFMDEDAMAAPDWLAQLRSGFRTVDVLGVGGAILPQWQPKRPFWFPTEFNWVVGCTYRGMPETDAPVRNLIGCNMAFRRHVFSQVGGFRNGMGRIGKVPVGCEETELCIRAGQQWPNGTFLYRPTAQVFHHVPASRAAWRYFWSRCYAEGLSKAQVAHFVGAEDGLANERSYTFRTLPLGVVRGVADTALRFDLSGLTRAAAIVAGLAYTTAGYLRGKVYQRSSKTAVLSTPSTPITLGGSSS
jgi:GT2 family glycosyltransferase